MPKKTNHAVLNMSGMPKLPKLCWEQNVASYHNGFVLSQSQVYSNSNEHDLNFESMEV